jgi:hypothetical protein
MATSFATSELKNLHRLFPKSSDMQAESAVVDLLRIIVEKYQPLLRLNPDKVVLVVDGFFSEAKKAELIKRGKNLWKNESKALSKKGKLAKLSNAKERASSLTYGDFVDMDVDEHILELFEVSKQEYVHDLERKRVLAQSKVDRLIGQTFKWSIEMAVFMAFVEEKHGILRRGGIELRIASGEADVLFDHLLGQHPMSHLGISRDSDVSSGYLHGTFILRQSKLFFYFIFFFISNLDKMNTKTRLQFFFSRLNRASFSTLRQTASLKKT